MPLKPGPPPKPKALRSNRVKRPEIGIVPARTDAAIIPKPPSGLLAKTRRVWREYWSSQVSGAVDQLADMPRIERWIRQVDEYDRVFEVFKKTRLVKGSQGQPVLNPLAAYLSTLETQISRAENELGITPLARLRLGLTFGEAKLTALELNRQLNALEQGGAEQPSSDDAWLAEWEPA